MVYLPRLAGDHPARLDIAAVEVEVRPRRRAALRLVHPDPDVFALQQEIPPAQAEFRAPGIGAVGRQRAGVDQPGLVDPPFRPVAQLQASGRCRCGGCRRRRSRRGRDAGRCPGRSRAARRSAPRRRSGRWSPASCCCRHSCRRSGSREANQRSCAQRAADRGRGRRRRRCCGRSRRCSGAPGTGSRSSSSNPAA